MSFKSNPPPVKLNYFQCLKGALHEGEVLNYVCIEKGCTNNGLICSVCKHDHPNHNVIPLKYLLAALSNHKQSALSSESFQSELEELQKLKNSFLYQLKIVVEKFAQQIQQLEEKIIEQFKQRKTELMNQIEMSMKFNEIIEDTISNRVKVQETFEKDFKILAGLIEGEKKEKGNIENLKFSLDLKKLTKDYENSYNSYSQKINGFLETSQLMIDQLLEPTKKLVADLPKPPTLTDTKTFTQSSFNQSTAYTFSPSLKPQEFVQNRVNIVVSNNNMSAECTATASERFGLIDGHVQRKGSIIRFKIDKLKNWIGLGVAIKNNVLGHGSFLLSSNGYSWSHATTQNNLVTTGFNFLEGNVIKVETNQNGIIFTNQTQNKTHTLPAQMTENEWKEVCFCVNLTSPGDKVTIV